MKLIAQIAAGIFFAGLLSWIFWISIIAAAAPKISAAITHNIQTSIPTYRTITTKAAAPAAALEEKPACANFVQMAGGERHCLDNTHRAYYDVRSATFPPTQLRSAAR